MNADKLSGEDIFLIVKECVEEVCDINSIKINEKITERTPLYGERGNLDSLALVSLVASIEQRFADDGLEISIMSDKAFSKKISPFLNIGTLVRFIRDLLKEPVHG